jgi:hypothetical protein
MPDASVSFGLEAGAFDRDLATAESRLTGANDRMAAGANRNVAAHDSLLKSNARVGHQISNVARAFTSGADAGDLLSVSLEAVGRSLKLGLGAIAGLFVGGLIVGEIAKAAQAAKKLREEVIALTRDGPDARFETLDKLISKLEEVHKKIGEVKKQGFWAAVGKTFGDLATLAPDEDITADGHWKNADHDKGMNKRTGGLEAEAQRLRKGVAGKARDRNDEQQARDGGDPFKADRMKAFHDLLPKMNASFMDKNMLLAAEELRGYAQTIKEINKKEQEHLSKISQEKETQEQNRLEKIKESMQLTLGDLAKNGREFAPGDDSKAGAGRLARRALKEEELARKAMLDEHYGEAGEHYRRAEEIKSGIPSLKDSQKELKGALSTTETYLMEVVKNTAKPLVNR